MEKYFDRKNMGYNKLCTGLLICLPIINQYRLLPISFLQVYELFIVLLVFIRTNQKIKVNQWIVFYAVFIIVYTPYITFWLDLMKTKTLLFKIVGFGLVMISFYLVLPEIFDYDYGLKLYKKITILCSIFVIIQFVLYYISGIGISFLLPNMRYGKNVGEITNTIIQAQISTGRFSSFFLEPAHQAQFSLPCLALLLFPIRSEKRVGRENYVVPLLISFGICLTTSLLGIMGVLLIWGFFYWKNFKRKLSPQKLMILIISIIGGIMLFSQPIIQEQFIKKINSLNHLANHDTSLFLRTMVGWFCFKDMNIFYKLFGCGYGNMKLFMKKTQIGIEYYNNEAIIGYMSGMSELFCSFGIIGVYLYFRMYWKKIRKCNDFGLTALVLCWIFIMFTSSAFENLTALFPMIFILSRTKQDKLIAINTNLNKYVTYEKTLEECE